MEPTKSASSKPGRKPQTSSRATSRTKPEESGSDKVGDAIDAVRDKIGERSDQIVGQVREKAGEVYDRAQNSISAQYENTLEYGRENPGTITALAFGAGIC